MSMEFFEVVIFSVEKFQSVEQLTAAFADTMNLNSFKSISQTFFFSKPRFQSFDLFSHLIFRLVVRPSFQLIIGMRLGTYHEFWTMAPLMFVFLPYFPIKI